MKNEETRPIEIFLALEHPVVIAGVENYLRANDRARVIGYASSLVDTMRRARGSVDIVILDLQPIPQMVKELRAALPETKAIVFSGREDPDAILDAVQAGARGYVSKAASEHEFLKAIEAVHSGDICYTEQASRVLVDEAIRERAQRSVELSPSEREVLKWLIRRRPEATEVAKGRTSEERADHLRSSVPAIEAHRERLMKKLQVQTLARLKRYAIENGIIDV